MGRFAGGIIVGIVVGAALALGSLLFFESKEAPPGAPPPVAPPPGATPLEAAEAKVLALQEALEGHTEELFQAHIEIDNLRQSLAYTRERLESAEAALAAREQSGTAAQPGEEVSPEILRGLELEGGAPSTAAQGTVLITGGAVPEALRESLHLDAAGTRTLEQALADEERRVLEAVFYAFSQDLPDVDAASLGEVGLEGIMGRLLPKLMPEIAALARLPAEERESLGSLQKALGADSYLARLGDVLRPERQETLRQLEGVLTPGTMDALRAGPLPADHYRLGEGFQFSFGPPGAQER